MRISDWSSDVCSSDLMIVASADKPDRTSARVTISDRQIEITHLGRGLGSDYLFRLAELREGMEAAALQRALGLTPRESDVLFWIAQGNSNPDASVILNISTRTVNKHLAQIYLKLLVDNRASSTENTHPNIANAD